MFRFWGSDCFCFFFLHMFMKRVNCWCPLGTTFGIEDPQVGFSSHLFSTVNHSAFDSSVVAAEDKGEVGRLFPAVSKAVALTVGETT